MEDVVPFHGLLCVGVCFSSGQCVSLLSWDSAPVEPPSFSQVWLTEATGKSTCYLDPGSAADVFRFYHSFERVIGATVGLQWVTPENLSVRVHTEGVELDLRMRIGAPVFVRGLNALLRTPARTLLRSRGTTDAGRRYLHQPHRLATIATAEATLNGRSLGSFTPAPRSLRVAGNPVPNRPMLSFCTHYLEPYTRSRTCSDA
ncbi:MAG TPA: hypothetical protein PLZ95_18500 [Bryobacteraceae bacterium]|nr:hypothetical protein [Bryobacteraceae bacterium]